MAYLRKIKNTWQNFTLTGKGDIKPILLIHQNQYYRLKKNALNLKLHYIKPVSKDLAKMTNVWIL